MDEQTDNPILQLNSLVEDKHFKFTISDNGIGIDPQVLKQIFTCGYSTKNQSDHKGLGLHYCANTIKEMGGAIHLPSPGVGMGTTLELTLPMNQDS